MNIYIRETDEYYMTIVDRSVSDYDFMLLYHGDKLYFSIPYIWSEDYQYAGNVIYVKKNVRSLLELLDELLSHNGLHKKDYSLHTTCSVPYTITRWLNNKERPPRYMTVIAGMSCLLLILMYVAFFTVILALRRGN